ncbi:hypothetical protein pEaSNUABM42_00236 [Erwinia phage pEa_SNUABM_42]|nr:hypothetical protein pEaSNUABM43_00237 [Erwinia phage pEa_SNUABM_43]QVW55553.1 hypothetical protein pEaSNUABM42_00236 [Erwinia phage pEa_SNUABM_42]
MLFEWLTFPLKRYAHKRRRSYLEAEFHKNTQNTYQRVLIGLALLTEPLEYNGNTYRGIDLMGNLELRCKSFDIVHQRFAFLLREYDRVLNTTGRNPDWSPYPAVIDPQQDKPMLRWFDEYFGTSSKDVVRQKLRRTYELLETYRDVYSSKTNPEQDVLFNLTRHLVRELETIVEHYL